MKAKNYKKRYIVATIIAVLDLIFLIVMCFMFFANKEDVSLTKAEFLLAVGDDLNIPII